jgi:digeranylgeranylglycerophospholipid reductase
VQFRRVITMEYDAIIVGGGPAGSVTARFAAESGAKVIILERRSEIGIPVLCGEGISQRIDKWGMLQGTRWIASKMDGAKIFSPNGTMVTLSKDMAGNETGYVVYRDIFDKELARNATKAGSDLMLNAEVTGLIKKNGKIIGVNVKKFDEEVEIYADIIVGADGVESKIGKWAGINTTLKTNDLETCAQYTITNIDYNSDYCEFYLGKKIAPGGYIWIFPKGEETFNVGIGVLASLSDSRLPHKLLNEFIKNHPKLKNGKPIRFLAGAVPVSKPIESVKNNLLLVGDAARHSDPITGGGLTTSLEGGKIAGETIGNSVEIQCFDKETLMSYEKKWKESFGTKLIRDYIVKEIMLDFDDKTLDMLADSLKNYKFEEFSTLSLIKALVKKHPTLLMRLTPLLKLTEKSLKKESK